MEPGSEVADSGFLNVTKTGYNYNKMVSIVIPVYNHAKQLELCLEAIREQETNFSYECIVIDNGSQEDIASVVNNYDHCRLLTYTKFQSPYPCRNLGIREAKYPLIVLLDSKCFPQPGWLLAGVNKLKNDEYDLLSGPKEHIVANIKDAYQIASAIMFQKVDVSIANGGIPLGNVFAKKDAFEKFGYFPEDIRSNGDTIWSNNATKMGARIGYEPLAVIHYYAKSKNQLLRQGMRIGYGNRQLYFKRGDASWLIMMRAIWNMRPMRWSAIRQKCQDHGWHFSTGMLFKVWVAMFHYNIFKGIGRLGIKRLAGISQD